MNTRTMTADDGAFEQQGALPPELDLVLARIRLRGLRRAAWLDYLAHGEAAQNGNRNHLRTAADALFVDRDAPGAELAWQQSHAKDIDEQIAAVEQALAAATDTRLHAVQQIFALAPLDVDILHCALALAVDPSLAALYAHLQGGASAWASETLVARLCGHGRCLLWSAESPLRNWRLVQERELVAGEAPALICDRQLRNWLLGQSDLQERLVGVAQLVAPEAPLAGWPVDETVQFFLHCVAAGEDVRSHVRVVGLPGSGRRTFASCVAAELGVPLLAIDADQVADGDWREIYVAAQRQAYLDRCALAWHGQRLSQYRWPQTVPPFPVQFVIAEPEQQIASPAHQVSLEVRLPQLTIAERRELWQRYLPAIGAWPSGALDDLAARHHVVVGDVVAIGRKQANDVAAVRQAVRAAQRNQLGQLAQRLDCSFTWADLVVSAGVQAVLEDFAFEARARAAFWEQPAARRLFPRGQGLIGLFSGPSGAGKTMAAQVIAAELDLDLFRVDLASVVSKYVGETSQNLERILARAAHMDIVLFFDEADALFSKRTEVKDAHDRFANTDTNYLLQAIESYDGIAILATNKKTNLDSAFLRRLRYVLEFGEPDAGLRLRIWRQLIDELAGAECGHGLAGPLRLLADEVALTGAQIKGAILTALFMAQRHGRSLGVDDLLAGLNRELLKEGRALSDREIGSLRRHGR